MGLEPLSVPKMHHKVEDCFRSSTNFKYERQPVGKGGSKDVAEGLDEAVGNTKRSDVVETEDAGLNEDVFVGGSSDHDYYGVTR